MGLQRVGCGHGGCVCEALLPGVQSEQLLRSTGSGRDGTEENPYAFKCLARGCGAVFARVWDYMAHIHAKSIEEWGPLLGTKEETPDNARNAEEYAIKWFGV